MLQDQFLPKSSTSIPNITIIARKLIGLSAKEKSDADRKMLL